MHKRQRLALNNQQKTVDEANALVAENKKLRAENAKLRRQLKEKGVGGKGKKKASKPKK